MKDGRRLVRKKCRHTWSESSRPLMFSPNELRSFISDTWQRYYCELIFLLCFPLRVPKVIFCSFSDRWRALGGRVKVEMEKVLRRWWAIALCSDLWDFFMRLLCRSAVENFSQILRCVWSYITGMANGKLLISNNLPIKNLICFTALTCLELWEFFTQILLELFK